MADHTPLDLDALEAALATAAAKPWRVSDGGIDAIVSLRNTALALIARLRAAEAEHIRYRDALMSLVAGGSEYVNNPRKCVDDIRDSMRSLMAFKRKAQDEAAETIAAAREAHAKALAHALRPLDEPLPFAVQFEPGHAVLVEECDAPKINGVLAARAAAEGARP